MSTNASDLEIAIQRLFDHGVRVATAIDIGCADGNFTLKLIAQGLLPDAVPVNIDANRIYEDSLKAIRDVVGGHYLISAVTDYEGEIEMTQSVHPYWSSVRPVGDPYWKRVNSLVTDKIKVPATTLDVLAQNLSLKPPFSIRLDVQGAERSVLAGARKVLENTHFVICEADIEDFQAINGTLIEAGFVLYDLTGLNRTQSGEMGWFYPIYISAKLEYLLPQEFWGVERNAEVIQTQIDRRTYVLNTNVKLLNRLKFGNRDIGRNTSCPCGSGNKYKQCCGSYNL